MFNEKDKYRRHLIQVYWTAQIRITLIAVAVFSVISVTACRDVSPERQSGTCVGLEIIENRNGLISRSQAEELATKMLSRSAPEVSGVKIEAIRASCLTTLGSYQDDLLKGRWKTNPNTKSPETVIWLVEVEGRSTPEGISSGPPFNFAMAIINARSGMHTGASRYQTPLLSPP